MVVSYACLTLQRVVVPAVLVLAALFRPVGISFVYLLMFFISPFIPIATNRNFKGSVTAYFIILIAISTILLLCHVALQVIIISLKIDNLFGSCSFTEHLLRHVGFVNLRNLSILAIVEWLAPEVVVFITSLTVYLVTKKLIVVSESVQLENGEGDAIRESLQNGAGASNDEPTTTAAAGAVANTPTPSKGAGGNVGDTAFTDQPIFDGLIKISPLFCLATLFFAAVLRPSVPGGFYFLIFLLSGSYWATFQSLQRGFALLLRFVMVVLVLHTLCIVSYQTPRMQEYLDKDNLIARLIGLEPMITSSCANDIRIIIYNTNFKLDSYLSPIVMFFSYYALALTTKNLIKPRIVAKPVVTAFGQQLENGSNNKFNRQLSRMTHTSRGSKKDSWTKTQRLNVTLSREHRPMITEPTETTPLVRHNTRKARTISHTESAQSASGVSGNDIPLNVRGDQLVYESNVSLCDQISYGFVSIGGFIYQNSYIFTNILMMAWSIVYHSWLTFVLLLWANVLWMIPNQRKAMMRSSPLIALYAEVLLIAQYIYGMNLYNNELPAKVDTTGINLQQIGLDRPQDHDMQPCVPLIVKTSFVLMFWVTSRQFFKEKTEKRRTSTISDMIAPMQLTVGATGSGFTPGDSKKTSKFMKKAGDIIKNLLVRLWMWLLVLVIFLCAITGKQMTGFRICYMALFLFFLLVFQSSSKVWVKVMYGFWLFLIFYAMFILILIYTYQFDKFDQYWNDYLNISKTLQTDIGLEQYKTKDLFLHLVSPTIIVVLTVIQVHYFHKRFIASLQQQPTAQAASRRAAPLTPRATLKTLTKSISVHSKDSATDAPDLESLRELIRLFFKKAKTKLTLLLKHFKNAFWRFMELHIMKAVYISAFLSAVGEVCFLHIIFIGLCLLGAISRVSVQTFVSRIISFIVTIIILTKMIYQVAYLDHSHYDVSCDDESGNVTANNAVWFGLEKASPAYGGLMGLLRKYIIYMVMVTLHAVVTLRQYQFRMIYGQQNVPTAKVLFPKVSRPDAEKNLEGMVKYLFNYGFYKFGMEISLIMLVSTITYRQDIVAVAYAVWLTVLLSFSRSKCSTIWGIFQWFITISIFVQYVLLVGFPPSLCLTYPWSGSIYSESIQRWTMLPGNLHYNHVPKLIFDFILLLMINRQKRVFYMESRYGAEYPGGNNKSVVKDIDGLGLVPFTNPTHDFLSSVRNYLDVFKYAILCGFYWVALAVVFLAGTNITDLLAIGYLVGAFVFLWEGSDFYLRPIKTIIRRWNWLILYNVGNILAKTCFQMAGCLFMQELTTNCCWLVHMLGITCASKATNTTDVLDEVVITTNGCPATTRHVVLLWDTICFGFLILQLRIFKSHYFCHIIVDTKANSILASRGAELIEDLRQKQIEHRQDHENEVLLKIKRKMEKIRATQQKMLKPIDKPTHFDDANAADGAGIIVKLAPLAHHSSFSSCQGGSAGYRTPDDDDDEENTASEDEACTSTRSNRSSSSSSGSSEDRAQLLDDIHVGEQQQVRVFACDASDAQTDYADINSLSDVADSATRGGRAAIRLQLPEIDIQMNTQQNTPSSDLTTIPLDGFLDVQRISVGSMPNSDVIMPLRKDSDEEESYEVFSPPAYDTLRPHQQQQHQQLSMHNLLPLPLGVNAPTSCSLSVNVSSRGSSVISSNLITNSAADATAGVRHRRQSSVNAVSWNETVSVKCAPKDTTPSGGEDSEDIPVTLRQKGLHRRHTSMGNATYSMDERSTLQNGNRRYSNVSWARDETAMRARARPHSWGPVEYGYPVPGTRAHKRKEIKLHPQAVRAGDYYMFDDMDEKFELDLIEDEVDFLEDKGQISESEKKLSRRKTLINVWKDIKGAEFRRQLYMRQRSYASAPGSRIGIKEELACDDAEGEGVGIRTSTHSEPLDYAVHRTTNEYFMEQTKPKPSEPEPSTSKVVPDEPDEPSESRKKPDPDSIMEKDSDEDIEANPIIRLLEGFLVSLTIRLNRFSRNYRYVNKILAEEKKALKESNSLLGLSRPGATEMFSFIKKNLDSDEHEDAALASSSSNTRNSNNALNNKNIPTPPQNTTTTTTNQNVPLESQPLQQQQQSQDPHVVDIIEMPLDTVDAKIARPQPASSTSLPKVRKPESLPEIRIKAPSFDRSHNGSGSLIKQWSYEKVDSASEFVLFEEENFASREHNIMIEVIISSWYAILSNTDLICYIVVFINQVVNASIISLPLPIMVFLWGTLSLPRPTKTFWVTLIAYTQAIVLIKCVFQYKLIWANYVYVNVLNQPLAWPKIFGIEMNPNYATCDLFLLLVLFFHRFILKSQGLWKSEYKDPVRHLSFTKMLSSADPEIHSSAESNEKALVLVGDKELQDLTEEEIADIEDKISIAESMKAEEDAYSDKITRLKRAKYFSSLRKFFTNLVLKPRLPSDVYALMFLCDFINFFVLLFGFTAFGSQQTEGDGGVQTYLAENKVPIPFLIMLLVQFILIVIDRALYLRKALVNKIIFHFFSVIGIHVWMFFVVPAVTERSFYSLTPPIVFYIIKCFYMLLSSYQIKCGYPKRILGNFLTKGFSLANMISFKVYMQMPFLYELRTILDWVCTDTTMTLFDWLKMEDIFSDIYFIKCSRQMEKDFPAIRAQKKALFSKLLMGGTIILIIVISIWGPLCLFALGNAVGQANRPFEASVSIRIGSYDPLYSATNRESIISFDENTYDSMQAAYAKNRSAITFFSNYDSEDVAAVKLAGNSPSLWEISPPDKERLLTELKNASEITARFTYSLTRIPPAKGLHGVVGAEVIYTMNLTFPGREAMWRVLKGESNEDIVIPDLIPKFIKVLNSGESVLVTALYPRDKTSLHRPLVLKMHSVNNSGNLWWEVRESCEDDFYNSTLSKLPLYDCTSGIVMYTFNDKKFPSTFSFLTAGGIIGLYTTFVLLASRFLKSFIAGQNRKIMFEDLPYVDRVLQLCLDIYLVREALEFALEEDLFAKLIFLYRSPETMIKWTRPKEEINDDETDSESLRSQHSSRRPEASLAPQH